MSGQSAISQANEKIRQVIESGAPELYLSYLGLTSFPKEIASIVHLETLILTGNQIKELPAEIHQLQKLRILDISGNKLTLLPEEMCHLPELRQLEVAANELKYLPKAIGNLGNLQTLDAFGNQISSLPDSIHFCHNLCNLRLSENSLTTLPEMFGDLRSLLTLDLSYNEIKTLPLSFFSLTQLKELYLNGNQLDVPFDILSRYSSQPELLLESIRDYQKNLSEKLAKQEQKSQQDKIKALTEVQLAERIVIKMSHYKSAMNGMSFQVTWPIKNNLGDITNQLKTFNHRVSDICTLKFCLTETMTSGKMKQVISALDSTPDKRSAKKSPFVSDLRAVARDNDLEHEVQLKTITFDQCLRLEASFSHANECERYVSLWLVLKELLAAEEFNLEDENMPVLEATLSHVISSYLHEHALANKLANGIVRLLLDELQE